MSELAIEFFELLENNRHNSETVTRFMLHHLNDLQVSLNYWAAETKEKVRRQQLKEKRNNRIVKYMLTFTIDPKLHENQNDEGFQNYVENYITKIIFDKCEIIYLSKEHKDSNVHWHVIIHCKGFFDQRHIQYYIKKYGKVKVSRSYKSEEDERKDYLEKEDDIKIIKGNPFNETLK